MQEVHLMGDDTLLKNLRHYLPAQAPLKDFIHHNTLHAFQNLPFHQGVAQAGHLFGYKGYLSINEYRALFRDGRIRKEILDKVIQRLHGVDGLSKWRQKVLYDQLDTSTLPRIGQLRAIWKKVYKINLDKVTHPVLFRIISSYLDQGVSLWHFPTDHRGLLESIRELERQSFYHFFRSKRVQKLLMESDCSINELLSILVQDKDFFEHYLFDQQMAHPGWSGMVAMLEDKPESLLDKRNVSLKDFVILELLLEIDALDNKFGENWSPLSLRIDPHPENLFDEVPVTEVDLILRIFQEAFEWSYYDEVLAGIQKSTSTPSSYQNASFQALFCIDDRCCSLRRYLEKEDPGCATFGTPGHFNVVAYFQPEHSHFYTKICPAPLNPNHLIHEKESSKNMERDLHFSKHSHSLLSGWLLSQTLGFWSAIKLAKSIFYPSKGNASVCSFDHMDTNAMLEIESKGNQLIEDKLKEGFTVVEMVQSFQKLLQSIGLVKDFAPLVYIIGHGASSVNNTHYAGYDCGACSGRPGSVNARTAAYIGNHIQVREVLKTYGISIPSNTHFISGLHDTTTDEIQFYDEKEIPQNLQGLHQQHVKTFVNALHLNAKERSRRFILNDTKQHPERIHEQIKLRAISLFEPRPEYNHATNALAIIGRRSVAKNLFLDRRSFLNSYDYQLDLEGHLLLSILQAIAPVCGGINLEYYFSRVDSQRLGAGSKLPHNVMGLIGVANGADGDLRPGLPYQMVEIHDPIRLLVIVEHFPEIVLETIKINTDTWTWFKNQWIHLAIVHPETKALFILKDEALISYIPLVTELPIIKNLNSLIESDEANFPVYFLQE